MYFSWVPSVTTPLKCQFPTGNKGVSNLYFKYFWLSFKILCLHLIFYVFLFLRFYFIFMVSVSLSLSVYTHTHTHTYIWMCVCVRACVHAFPLCKDKFSKTMKIMRKIRKYSLSLSLSLSLSYTHTHTHTHTHILAHVHKLTNVYNHGNNFI